MVIDQRLGKRDAGYRGEEKAGSPLTKRLYLMTLPHMPDMFIVACAVANYGLYRRIESAFDEEMIRRPREQKAYYHSELQHKPESDQQRIDLLI